ncbi:radical SAM family heme chaperone HemW [Paracoccaceae bacterium GXU_MW_L88]
MADGLGVYIHWPFCAAKCPYCDFNSHVVSQVDQTRWLRAFQSEIQRMGRELREKRVETVFFGGGTPSLMAPETVHGILDEIRKTWATAPNIEITLEANPTSVEANRFRGYADAGVNRISMGIQAMNDADLKRLGRLHSVAEARTAFDTARKIFDRVSFDLIYARQDQTLDDWRKELREATAMAVDHFSLYQLTIEPGTRFGDLYKRGKLRGLPSPDLGADFYELTQEETERAGLPAYEISNHARPGAESRHNLIYWNYGDYIGLGPGAHGRFVSRETKWATETQLAPAVWLKDAERDNGESLRQAVTAEEQFEETVMMGLRLTDGLPLEKLDDGLNQSNLRDLIDSGYLARTNTKLKATSKGRPVLNRLIEMLLT